jgi:hypothetical protein
MPSPLERWASRYPRFVRYFSRTGRYQLASANPKQRVTFPRIARYISGVVTGGVGQIFSYSEPHNRLR